MILKFKAYSRENPDIEEVLANKRLRGCHVNEPIIVFGDTQAHAFAKLSRVYKDIHKFIIKNIDLRINSFTVEVDDMIGLAIKEKYGFK